MDETDHPIRAINYCMQRLPLILEVLGEMSGDAIHPGDEEIERGCHQAVSRILDRLGRIEPKTGAAQQPLSHQELEIAHAWLLGELPATLLLPGHYEALAELLERHLGKSPGTMCRPAPNPPVSR